MDYVTQVEPLDAIGADAWNGLLASSGAATPFLRYEYLDAMHRSASATPATGWTPAYLTLRAAGRLAAACPLYLKGHSWGEYVFDWAWAQAYEQHGLAYYPKALVAPPFTPVPGTRLLARDAQARRALVEALVAECKARQLSSLHLLFLSEEDAAACEQTGLMLRHGVQFHWTNSMGVSGVPYDSYDTFLAQLSQDKRKKIRQEQRKVADAGVSFRWLRGQDITPRDWDFFYRCYERTYLEHGNPPYLTRDFFRRMASELAPHWLLFIAERSHRPIACSLIAIDADQRIAWGRYWGALERVDCLHFDACYHQPLRWCIEHGILRFEGGAQGEHKMARALMPVKTTSAHWLAHPAFADAVSRFLDREGTGIDRYLDDLGQHTPFRADAGKP